MPRLQQGVSLKPYNTFGIDVTSDWWYEIGKEADLLQLLSDNPVPRLPILVLGGGSNILFTQDFEGLVLKNNIPGIDVQEEGEDHVVLRVGSGVIWHDLVEFSLEKGWGGLENLSLIPGTVGAAPIQNIGAYGAELKDIFVSLEAIHLGTLSKQSFSLSDCRFGYRDSVFKREAKGKFMITNVSLRLSKNPVLNLSYGAIKQELEKLGITTPSVMDVGHTVMAIRNSKLPNPKQIGNAGSFFKNPVIPETAFSPLLSAYPQMPHFIQEDGIKIPAGWLIETAGWKGKSFNNCGVYPKQALVLVNYDGASGKDIIHLAHAIQESVFSIFGITLELEVNIH